MSGTYQDFLSSLLAFESGWDRARYNEGIIQDWQLDQWAGGSVQERFPQYSSWSQLTDAEWEAMAYQSMNSLGFVGFQFGEALLIDLGYYDDTVFYGNGAATNTWDGTWTGKNGVNSLSDFTTKAAQDVAIQEAFGYNLQVIENQLANSGQSLNDYIRQTKSYVQNGQTVTVELTLTGIMAAAHLRGAWGTASLLQGGSVSTDEYGTSILQYIEQFGGFDAPSVAEQIAFYEGRLTGDEGLGAPDGGTPNTPDNGGGNTGGTDNGSDGGGTDSGVDGGVSNINPWSSSSVYLGNDLVVVDGVVYQANWWTNTDPREANGVDGSGQPWKIMGPIEDFQDGGSDNGNTDNGGSDNGNTDNGGSDNGNTDNGGSDNGNTDNGGSDNGNTDNGGSDNGNTDNGGTVPQPDMPDGPIISAYFPEWGIYGRDYNVADIPAENLTHLIYAFTKIGADGELELFDSFAAIDKAFTAGDSVDGVADTWEGQDLRGNFNQLAELKEAHPHLKVMMAVGGWTLSGNFSTTLSTEAGRAKLVDSMVEFLKDYPMFDGFDLDWEYPGSPGAPGNAVDVANDGKNYELFLAELRQDLDTLGSETGEYYQISVASPAGHDKIATYNVAGVAEQVDFVNLMAYDFYGAWQNTTGHQSGFYDESGGNYDIVTAVDQYLDQGVPAGKIVLGAPMYTRAWSNVNADNPADAHGVVAGGKAPGSFEAGVYDYKDLLQKLQDPNSGWKLYYDDDAQAAFVWNQDLKIFSSIETPETIGVKAEWVQQKGLGGMMFWDLSNDATGDPESLLQAAHDILVSGMSLEHVANASQLEFEAVFGGDGQVLSDFQSPDGWEYLPPEGVVDNGGSDNGNTDNGGTDNGTDNGETDNGTDNGGSDNGSTDNGGNSNVDIAAWSASATYLGGDYVAVDGMVYLANWWTQTDPRSENGGPGTGKPWTLQGPVEDFGGLDNGGTDNGGMDNGGTDDGGMDHGGMDDGHDHGTDVPADAQMIMITPDSESRVISDFNPQRGDMLHLEAGVIAERLEIQDTPDGLTVIVYTPTGAVANTTVLTGVQLSELTMSNFMLAEESALNEVAGLLGQIIETPSTGGFDVIYDTDGSSPPVPSGGSALGGVVWEAEFGKDDIVGFNPAADQINFGNASVHGLILNMTPNGEPVIDNPWGPDMQILQGVQLSDLSIENFGVVGNEHLRQDLGGVLSWEKGIGPRDADTFYIRSHEYGKGETITGFDPAVHKISFLYFGTRERLSVEDTAEGMVISVLPTGQSFTFSGVQKADLIPGNLEFHFDQVMEDNLEAPFGVDQNDVSLVSREGLLTPEAPAGATTDGFQVRDGVGVPLGDGTPDTPDAPDTPDTPDGPNSSDTVVLDAGADTVGITWDWGREISIQNFDASEDVLDFTGLGVGSVTLAEVGSDLTITVENNGGHSYILEGVQAEDLSLANLTANSWNSVVTDAGGIADQLQALGNTDFLL